MNDYVLYNFTIYVGIGMDGGCLESAVRG